MTLGRPTDRKNREIEAEKPMIISISGDLGSGKSLLSSALVERWQADRYSTGMVQRRIADRMGITTLELNRRAETDKSIDEQIDSVFKNLVKTPKNLVVDSRMAFHFLPMSFRIKLEVDPHVAAQRIQGDTSRVGEGNYNTLADIEAAIIARKASERARFKEYYNADIEDHAGYDLVINTTDCPPEIVGELANACIARWHKGQRHEKCFISPRHLYTAVDANTLDAKAVDRHKAVWPELGHWPEGGLPVVKTGQSYVLLSNVDWLSAALKAGKKLVPVKLMAEKADMPDAKAIETWEKAHNFNYLAKNS